MKVASWLGAPPAVVITIRPPRGLFPWPGRLLQNPGYRWGFWSSLREKKERENDRAEWRHQITNKEVPGKTRSLHFSIFQKYGASGLRRLELRSYSMIFIRRRNWNQQTFSFILSLFLTLKKLLSGYHTQHFVFNEGNIHMPQVHFSLTVA